MIWQAFRPDVRGTFIERPNRFLVIVDTPQGRMEAHCPNPGRLREILCPGVSVLLEKASGVRKTEFTLVAVERGGLWIPLASARANIAGGILLNHLFAGAKIVPEYTRGQSRFDFMATVKDRKILVEVKACTLESNDVAMFPDAPSERAVKHLEHLAQESEEALVLFTTYFPSAKSFVPHLHTDPVFAQTIWRLRNRIRFQAVVWKADKTGTARLVTSELPVELDPLEGLDYSTGLPLAAWETDTETTFALADSFDVWSKNLCQKSKVERYLGKKMGYRSVQDLRVFSHRDLRKRWIQESQNYFKVPWKAGKGAWQEMQVPGRPLDTPDFWDFFLPYRHQYWLP